MSSSETSPQGIVPEATPSGITVAPWDKSAHATSEPLGNATAQPAETDQPTKTSEAKPTEGISSEPFNPEPLGNATAQPSQLEPAPEDVTEEPLGNATAVGTETLTVEDSTPESVEEAKPSEGIADSEPLNPEPVQDVTADPTPLIPPVSVSSSVVSLSDSLRWEVLSQVASSSAVGLRLLGEYSLVSRLKFVDVLCLVALFAVGLPVMSLFMGSPFAPVILVCAIVSLFMAGVNNHLAVKYSLRFRSVVFDKVPQGKLSKYDIAYLIIGYLMLAVFTTLHIMTISSWGGNLEALYDSYRYLEGSIEFISYMLIMSVFILNFLLFIYLSVRYISRSLSSDYAEFADYLNNEWTLGNAIALTVKE